MHIMRASNERYEVTVEQVGNSPEKWIATIWDRDHEYEVDRTVKQFETRKGAVEEGFLFLAYISNFNIKNS
jgi:hypothetical protein